MIPSESESEKEAVQASEGASPEAPPAVAIPGEGVPPAEKPPVGRFRRFINRAILWLVVLLVVFLLGALAEYQYMYRPAALNLDQAKADLVNVQQQATQQADKFSNLNSLESQNKALQDQIKPLQMHIAILSALSNVTRARLALLSQKPADARMALTKTPDTLKTLQTYLSSDQQKVVTDMQARLQLASSELDSNSYAAQSDLDVLATSLITMENTYFTKP